MTIRPGVFTAADQTEIQALVTVHARALGACAADEFAVLFARSTKCCGKLAI